MGIWCASIMSCTSLYIQSKLHTSCTFRVSCTSDTKVNLPGLGCGAAFGAKPLPCLRPHVLITHHFLRELNLKR